MQQLVHRRLVYDKRRIAQRNRLCRHVLAGHCQLLVGHVHRADGNLCGLLPALQLHALGDNGKLLAGVQFLDLGPRYGNVAQHIAVKGDVAANLTDQLAVKGVAISQHQHVWSGLWGGLRAGHGRAQHKRRRAQN